MRTAVLWFLLRFIPLAVTHIDYSCLDDRRYVALNICIIDNFRMNHSVDLADVVLPNVTQLEFRTPTIRRFGVDMFQLIGDAKRLTLRDGFVREVLIHSATVEELRVLNTDLVELDALAEHNYSLKKLAVRSPVFSRWSPNLMYLTALEVIDVAYCNFSYLNLDWFAPFERLQVLDASKNRLHSIGSTPFVQLKALEELYISGNRLEFLWRFPDAFPKLAEASLSENRWLCEWLSMARDVIWRMSIVLMDSDFNCGEGWVSNGGLCCRHSVDREVKRGQDKQNKHLAKSGLNVTNAELSIILVETESRSQEFAIGAEMGNSTVYFDEPIPVR